MPGPGGFSSLRRLAPRAWLLSAALVSCQRDSGRGAAAESGKAGGTVVVSVPADVETLFPPFALANQSKLAIDLLFDRLSEIGDSLNTIGDAGFRPQLADRWTWASDSLSIAFHLNPQARWHDGVPVRASDVRFTYEMYRDSVVGADVRSQLSTIDSVTVRDSLTAVFWFSRRDPEQFFNATYQMYICPAHLLDRIPPANLRSADFGRHPVGSGRFRFMSWTPGASVDFVSDTANYRGRAQLDRVILSVAPDFTTAVARLFSGEADFYQVLLPENIAELARHPSLRAVPYTDPSYGFLWFNLRDRRAARPHPVLGDRRVRRALGMALDRARMLQNVFDSLAVVPKGPFYRSAAFADSAVTPLPYDTAAASRLLDSAGWMRGPDGARRKGNRPLALSLVVPTSSKTRLRYAQLIQDQLARIGVAVSIEAIEFGAFKQRIQTHDFDATISVWVLDPSPSGLRQSWETAGETGGVNWGSYSNPVFDAAVDSALAALDPARRRFYLRRAFQTITDDAPAVWLYEPRQVAGVHRRVQLRYLRPDAWWAHLADWTIAPSERIARDHIGLGPGAR